MEMTAKGYLDKLIRVRDGLPKFVDDVVLKNEDKITGLNIDQISRHQNSDGGLLKNSNKTYSGYYQPATVSFAQQGIPSFPITSKTVGNAYNFTWDGKFFEQFKLLKKDGDFLLHSDGESTNQLKKAFFDGYDNLYGLTNDNEKKLNYEIILPEILEYVNSHL